MGLTHASDSPIRWNYVVEMRNVTDDTKINWTWFIVYQQNVDMTTGKILTVREMCRCGVKTEAVKICDMYRAVCPADKRMPKVVAIIEQKRAEKIKNIRAVQLDNGQMLKLIEIIFIKAGVPADIFHNALVEVVAPTLQATKVHVNTSIDAPALPPGEPGEVRAARMFDEGFTKKLTEK